MQRSGGDTIKFEWRNEVAAICQALDVYSKEHADQPTAEYKSIVILYSSISSSLYSSPVSSSTKRSS